MNHLLLIFLCLTSYALSAEPSRVPSKLNSVAPSDFRATASGRPRQLKKMINFYFDNEDLIDIINFLAGENEVNIVLPIGANAINAKVTLHLDEKISVEQAWNMLYTLLDIAGYSMIAKADTYTIVKTSKDVNQESLPLYIVKPDEIPNSDKRIRYLYYFSNIKIDNTKDNDIVAVLANILPDMAQPPFIDPITNSVLITDKANNIRALMKIISALDNVEAQEKPEVIQLRYVSPDTVANLFNELLKTAGDANQARLNIRVPNNSTYFKKVKIIPYMRKNSIIVIGRPQAIERVREFIHKSIDVELESGKSILHVYQLQYLDARRFAPQLAAIVKSENIGGTGQSRTDAQGGGGPERFFDEVIIRSDYTETVSGEQSGGTPQGSNNLIIAARNDDWQQIRKLIEELDIPQPQVIIEVLIADLRIEDLMSLGASVRNPLGTGLPYGVNFQSGQATDVLANTVSNPTTIATDLLRRAYNDGGKLTAACDTPGADCFSAAKFFPSGTTVLSFNDTATGQTWGIGQVRRLLLGRKVLSQPHLIATNNTKAEIIVSDERLAEDQGSGSTGGTTTQTRKWLTAALQLEITPRISSNDTVNLNVKITIDQFDSANFNNNNPNTANKITRRVITNANVNSGNVLALGGLTRIDTTVEQTDVPLISKIPVIGWLFKDRTNNKNKNNLTVFISPTIIEPRLRGGVGKYTKNHVELVKSYTQEGALFDNLRDPITRWFFNNNRRDTQTAVEDFIAQDEFIAPTVFDVNREKRPIIASNKPISQQAAKPAMMPDKDPRPSSLKALMADTENPFKPINPAA